MNNIFYNMESYQTIILLYLLFMWLVVLHTFEEISQGIFGIKIGKLKMNMKKYLTAASMITTVNIATLALIVLENKIALYFAIFMVSVFGILQAIVHSYGFIKEGFKARKIGVGFYSSIPLSFVGIVLLYKILQII